MNDNRGNDNDVNDDRGVDADAPSMVAAGQATPAEDRNDALDDDSIWKTIVQLSLGRPRGAAGGNG